MVKKGDAISTLKTLITDTNRDKVEKYINIISSLSDEEYSKVLEEKSIYSIDDIVNMVNKNERREEEKEHEEIQHEFTKLNDLVSYGRRKNTVHIHVVPSDVRSLLSRDGLKFAELQLIDAIEKIQGFIKDEKDFEDVLNVYAVSGIIKRPISKIFENLGFDVKTMSIQDAKEDVELGKFYDMFKDKKDLGRAILSKEKLLSEEWNIMKDNRKQELINKCSLIKQAVEESEKMVTKSEISTHEQRIQDLQHVETMEINN